MAGLLASLAVAHAETGFSAANLAAGLKIKEGRPGRGNQAGLKPISCACDRSRCCSNMLAAMAAPAECPPKTEGVTFNCHNKARKPSLMPCSDMLPAGPLLVKACPGKSGAMTWKRVLSNGIKPRQLKLPEPVPCNNNKVGPCPMICTCHWMPPACTN